MKQYNNPNRDQSSKLKWKQVKSAPSQIGPS